MKKLQLLVLGGLLFFGSAAVATEAYTHLQVDAVDRNVAVLVDGKTKDLAVKPLIIDGKLMLSIRDVAKLLNKNVVWNGKYNIVNFGTTPKVEAFPTEVQLQTPNKKVAVATNKIKYIEQMQVLRNVGPFYQLSKRKIAIAGQRYDHGIVVDLDPSIAPQAADGKTKAEVKILLNQNYTSLDGYIGVDDFTMNSKNGYILSIYGDGDKLFTSDRIEPGDFAFHITKDDIGNISRVKILKIEIEYQNMVGSPGENPKTRAALANFKLYRKY